jgi:hypothetical protein
VLTLRAIALGLAGVAEGESAAIAASVSIGTAGEAAAEASLPIGIRPDSLVEPRRRHPQRICPLTRPRRARAFRSGWTPSTLEKTRQPFPRPIGSCKSQRSRWNRPETPDQPASGLQALLEAWDELASSDPNAIDAVVRLIAALHAALVSGAFSGSAKTGVRPRRQRTQSKPGCSLCCTVNRVRAGRRSPRRQTPPAGRVPGRPHQEGDRGRSPRPTTARRHAVWWAGMPESRSIFSTIRFRRR